ncbi:hypothetical protein C900_01086 [Fulvivirga imtechensis AK7]|uniref:PKD domain-containing protein n=1 Tax=Fulvivirga imtechensis AK7 TaxID=1237149 RepID=L8JZS9_9BACT|nr:PKD domain-containing protein [Fulvivirga imtechensis]ELR72707.1 hypothetical protein C900_01086 [Fulvivirga imtechensis AK7]
MKINRTFSFIALLLCPLITSYSQSITQCSDLGQSARIYEISAANDHGTLMPGLDFEYLFFNIASTTFDFNEGQLYIDETSAILSGTLTLTTGGNTNNPVGSQWLIYLRYTPSTSGTPNTDLGQGAELTDTWKYYELDPSESYMYNVARSSNVAAFLEIGTPLQTGVGANNIEIDVFGASASYQVSLGSGSGTMNININLDFSCPSSMQVCGDIATADKLYTATSSTAEGILVHSLAVTDLFGAGSAIFDFTSGQLHHTADNAFLYGELTLRTGGGVLNGTNWGISAEFDATDILDPNTDLGQGEDRVETWLFYLLNSDRSYFYQIGNPNNFIWLEQLGHPFQIGIGAGGQDINEMSAAGNFVWHKDGETGSGSININIEDTCPPDIDIRPVLECVEFNADENTYVAHFGYLNEGTENIIIPAGENNKFTPTPVDRGQVFNFLPGRQADVFQVEFDGTNLVWTLTSPNGSTRTSTASDNPDQRCPVTAVPPTATVSGSSKICEGSSTTFNIDLTGVAPWVLTYDSVGTIKEITIQDSPYMLHTTQAGSYSLQSVKDANELNGTATGTASVSFFEHPSANLSGSAEVCPGEMSELTVSLTGEGPWTITYTDGINDYEMNIANAIHIFEVPVGSYNLISVSDAHCIGTATGSATIGSSAPTATIFGGGEICATEKATISISMKGTPPWSVTYTDGTETFEVTTSESSYTFETDKAATYELVSVSDAHCSGVVTGAAQVEKPSLSGLITMDDEYCPGTIALTAELGGTPTSLLWTVSGGNGSVTNANSPEAAYTTHDDDTFIVITLVVSDGCSSLQLAKTVEVIRPNAHFTIDPDPGENPMLAGIEYSFTPEYSGDAYKWRFGDGSTSRSINPVHTYNSPGVYDIILEVSNGACKDEQMKTLEVISNETLFIPNVFSPTSSNSDNNVVKVYGENLSPNDFTFQIYNRWGKVVYSTTNLTEAQEKGWNGTSGGEEKENNVFTYIVRGQYNDGRKFEKTGTVTLAK